MLSQLLTYGVHQALRALELDNVAGVTGKSVDATLGVLTGLTWLVIYPAPSLSLPHRMTL